MRSYLYILAACLGLAACGEKRDSQTAPPPAEVTVTRPVERKIVEWDEYTGRLQSPESVEIRSRVEGYLQSINFNDGEMVQRGQLLFVIDPRPYEAAVNRAKAALVQAEAQERLAETNFARAKDLQTKKVISQQEFDSRLNDYRASQAAVEQAKASLSATELDLGFTRITAPVSGRVSRYFVSAGNLVSGGSDGTLLTTVVSLDPLYCYFEVDENSFLRYSALSKTFASSPGPNGPAGLPVEMRIGNEEGYPHKGTLSFVDNQVDPETSTIQLRATFPNPEMKLTPGLFARIRIPAREEHVATLLPDTAVGTDQSVQFVYVVDDTNTVALRPVELGPLVDGLRVIRKGVSPEDRVIVDGLMRVRPRATVKPIEDSATSQSSIEETASAQKAEGRRIAVRPAQEVDQ